MRITAFSLLIFILLGCSKKEPIRSEYVSIYILIRMANTQYGSTTDSATTIRSSIFKNFAIPEKQYIEYIAHIKEEPKLWEVFQQQVISELKVRKEILLNPPQLSSASEDESFADDSLADSSATSHSTQTIQQKPVKKDITP